MQVVQKFFGSYFQQRAVIRQIRQDRYIQTGGDPRRLEHFGYKVYSQSDEDGIIDEIFKRIGTTNKVFVEFGVEVGLECNTRYLLEQGWTGLWIEANPDYIPAVHHHFKQAIESGHLKVIHAKVTAENINNLISSGGISGEIDLLSIDIDSNDYHVWRAIDVVNPRVCCIEHNCSFPPPQEYIMAYDPDFQWFGQTSNYGASIVAMEKLAKTKGMTLVGCGLYSPNGFYVRNDLINKDIFSPPFTPERFYHPLQYEKIVTFPTGKFMRNNQSM